jgi:hypothetical protein
VTARTDKDKLVGDWKFYLKDKTSFEFLRLNSDGTGLKCFGQTINDKDTLFLNHVTTLLITKWEVSKRGLILKSNNTVSFKVNPEYHLSFLGNDKIELAGEHLIFYLYPSILNRKEFQRTVIYQKADKISGDYGVKATTCIVQDRNLFTFKPIDNSTQLVEYKGFPDLIPHLISCNHGYEYAQKYHDPPYSLNIPMEIKRWSFGFGDKNFYISFKTNENDSSETSIVIYYDFYDELKNFYFSQIENGSQKKNIVNRNSVDIYKTDYDPDKFEGRLFVNNSLIIMYYTKDEKSEERLQKCISTFRFK